MTKSPVVYTAGLLRIRGDRIDDRGLDLAERDGGPAALLPAERLAAGTTTAGSTPRTFRARWLIARRALEKHAFNAEHASPRRPAAERPEKLVDRRSAAGAVVRVIAPARARRCSRLRREDDGRCDRRRGPAAHVPVDDLQRPPPPRRGLTGDADGMSDCTAARSSRGLSSCGAGWPRQDRACRRSSRACPMPAGTGLDRRTFLSRSLGAALTVYGAAALAPRALDEAIARASAAGRNDRVLVTVFAPGGWDSLSLLYPSGDPQLPAPAADPRPQGRRRAEVLGRLAAPLAPVLRVALAPARRTGG